VVKGLKILPRAASNPRGAELPDACSRIGSQITCTAFASAGRLECKSFFRGFGNFHEHFITESFQPFAEYEWRATQKLVVTAGIKAADYYMALNQYQDNGSAAVGCLGPGAVATTYPKTASTYAGAPACVGGVDFVTHRINYNNWLPTLTARYRIMGQWSVYGQFAEGSIIPLSSVFDVPGGNVLSPPKPTLAKTYQTGSVLKLRRFTLDADFYYIHFQNGYDT
jgi:iron complex outermembrane receptor protein